MKKNLLLILCTHFILNTFAQQGYYIYLQSDDRQPFYARLSDKLYSSSENGYLIIPRLGDSGYLLTIGFAKNLFPEQNFPVSMNRNDKGFQLKNFADKGWGLVNIQNGSIIMNSGLPAKKSDELTGSRKTDEFSELLANVVNDSAILYSAVQPKMIETVAKPITAAVENEQVKTKVQNDSLATKEQTTASVSTGQTNDSLSKNEKAVLIPEPAKKDSTAVSRTSPPVKQDIPANQVVQQEIKSETPKEEKPFITKLDEKIIDGTYRAVYLEQYNVRTDTIDIMISEGEVKNNMTVKSNEISPVSERSVKEESTQKTSVPSILPDPSPKVKSDSVVVKRQTIQIINSDCKNFASDNDVDKFRVKLMADNTIDDKINTAKKFFKSRCYSIKQIRALTELFPSDESRLRFFSAAYPYVSDTGNFYLLKDALDTPLYKDQFKAMVK